MSEVCPPPPPPAWAAAAPPPRPALATPGGVVLALVPSLVTVVWTVLFLDGAQEAIGYTDAQGGETTNAEIALLAALLAIGVGLLTCLLGLVVQASMALGRAGTTSRMVVSVVVHALIGGGLLLVTLVFSALLLEPDGVRRPGLSPHLEYVGCLLLGAGLLGGALLRALLRAVLGPRRPRIE
ncbi:hypothetical protein [Nocardioides sp.]|uniref:hypothetical protein n=1 Tax=Nocardioides sp. TaxID=35761 RepID=UPI003517E1E2